MAKVEWLTTKQAAELIGYNPNYIRYLVEAGKLPAQKLGRDWIIQQTDLLAYIRQVRKKGQKRGPKTCD